MNKAYKFRVRINGEYFKTFYYHNANGGKSSIKRKLNRVLKNHSRETVEIEIFERLSKYQGEGIRSIWRKK
ncbi:hypothetical protein [Brevibacillus sp. Leaf182]|uniref:hypothetical protein n=1 Tax=Brevibacillus sp. Leaf182 TaxID=1736290 RepID=UPI0006F64A53|nr:hypothetical protein [Brevibacillus sp. Leaf182]RAT97011.1 hypothetical protein ASG16_015115 [Brevibacillus sp. Leaf182]